MPTIIIHPNPVQDVLKAEFFNLVELQGYEIYNTVGQLVQKGQVPQQERLQIEVAFLNQGVYFLALEMRDGGTRVEKFIKQ